MRGSHSGVRPATKEPQVARKILNGVSDLGAVMAVQAQMVVAMMEKVIMVQEVLQGGSGISAWC